MIEPEKYTNSQIVIPLLANWFFSVTCVLANKFLFRLWKFGVALTTLHFIVTFSALAIMCAKGDFKFKKLSIASVIPLSASFCGSIALNNLSIQYNSVGFYQTMKISSMPIVCLFEYFWLGTRFSSRIKSSLAIIIVGIILCTVQDFRTVCCSFLLTMLNAFISFCRTLLGSFMEYPVPLHRRSTFSCPRQNSGT